MKVWTTVIENSQRHHTLVIVMSLLVFACCKDLVCPRDNANKAPCKMMSTQTACLFCQIVGSPAGDEELLPRGPGQHCWGSIPLILRRVLLEPVIVAKQLLQIVACDHPAADCI